MPLMDLFEHFYLLSGFYQVYLERFESNKGT